MHQNGKLKGQFKGYLMDQGQKKRKNEKIKGHVKQTHGKLIVTNPKNTQA